MSIQAIKEELQQLSKAEQAELMHFMIELLASEEVDISEEWKSELDRREKARAEGHSKGKEARDVLRKYLNKK